MGYEFIIVYTFDFTKYTEHFEMLLLSIISIMREFKDYKFLILIYTMTLNELESNIKILNLNNKLIVRLYEPNKYNHTSSNFTNDRSHFNYIGHSRIFIVDELLKEFECPVIYLDNDTGIHYNYGKKCYELIKNSNEPLSYCKEIWTSFNHLYENEGLLLELKKTENINWNINGSINPFNNGIIIFPYNKNIFNFLTDIKDNYNFLNLNFNSIYHDMFSFSLSCYKFNYIKTIDTNSNIKPCFIHYYLNKYENFELIKYINKKIIFNYLFKNNSVLNYNEDYLVYNNDSLITYIFCEKTIVNSEEKPKFYRNNKY